MMFRVRSFDILVLNIPALSKVFSHENPNDLDKSMHVNSCALNFLFGILCRRTFPFCCIFSEAQQSAKNCKSDLSELETIVLPYFYPGLYLQFMSFKFSQTFEVYLRKTIYLLFQKSSNIRTIRLISKLETKNQNQPEISKNPR